MDQEQQESPFKSSGGAKRIYAALLNSLRGFKLAYRHESAFRQELFLVLILLPLACYVHVTAAERVLLIASALLILIVELLNSSVEAAIDRISLERHQLSGRAKDLGSSAVMIALINCAITWGLILSGS
ncbi:MAG: diacylglycerol kinase [Burkholderiaceae bacterium]|nr:MAG: diacylglycerol kinase [Burkholderiaceae bacterium]